MSQQSGSTGKSVSKSTYLILALALGAMTFFGMCNPQGPNSGLPGIAGSVGDEEITQQEFVRAYERQSEQLRRQYGDDFNAGALKVASTVLDQLISGRALYLKAVDLGLKATDDEVINYLGNIDAFTDKDGKFSQEFFIRFLRGNRYSEASFQEELRRTLTIEKLRQSITGSTFVSSKAVEMDYKISETKIDVEYLKFEPQKLNIELDDNELEGFMNAEGSDAKIKAWYESHQSEFKVEEKVKARHILISYKGAMNATAAAAKRSKADAKKKAEEVLAKAKADSNFIDLAKAETDEPNGKKTGGDLGFFARGAMVKEFSDVAFKLEAGQMSEVVESPFGFHIIKVEQKQAAKETSLDDATPKIAKTLILQDKGPKVAEERAQKVLEQLKSGSDAKDLLGEYKAEWKKTGEISLTSRYVPGLGSQPEVKDAILTLTPEQKLHEKVLKSGKNFYVLRLAKFKEADLSKLHENRRKQLTASASFSLGYGFYNAFESGAVKDFEKTQDISKADEYLAIDAQQAAAREH
ncbi:MAG: peptidylprolyl isomerase [Oligoflexales bacterium]|nr:peptidylprolyl isomerase [Oligoflexales bacterium]